MRAAHVEGAQAIAGQAGIGKPPAQQRERIGVGCAPLEHVEIFDDQHATARPQHARSFLQASGGSVGGGEHAVDQHDAPLDPNFTGAGRVVTDAEGRYRFTSVKPGAYPWKNHRNAWRPAHIHFSLFGPSYLTRLVTQMYFPGDPLFPFDPIFNSITDEKARNRLISRFDMDTTEPEWALGYIFDIVLRGREATPRFRPA